MIDSNSRPSARLPSISWLSVRSGLLYNLVQRNLKVKYKRSALGFLWTLLNPIITVLVLIEVFTHVLRMPIPHYWAFLLSGYFFWNFTQQTLNAGTYVLAEHVHLARNVALPLEFLILSAALSRLVEFLTELMLVVAVLVVFHHDGVPVSFVLLPVLVTLQCLLVVGLQLPIAIVSVFYHDLQHALPVALLPLFYLSPVFYSVDMVPEEFRTVYYANPLAQLLDLYHIVLYEGAFPSIASLSASTLVALGTAMIGYVIFRRFKDVIPEIV